MEFLLIFQRNATLANAFHLEMTSHLHDLEAKPTWKILQKNSQGEYSSILFVFPLPRCFENG